MRIPPHARAVLGTLMLMLAVLLTSCGADRGQPKVTEIRSDDGRASIAIPDGALPKGLALKAIRVSVIKPQDAPARAEDGAVLHSFRLEPAGTQFQKPVTFTLTLPLSADTGLAPLLMQSWGAAIETQFVSPERVTAQRDLKTGTVSISADIQHFSTIVVDERGLFAAETQPPAGEFVVGQSLDWTLTIRAQERRYTNHLGGAFGQPEVDVDVVVSVANGTTFGVSPQDPVRTLGALQPRESNLPAVSVRAETGYRAEQRLTCAEAGEDRAYVPGGLWISFTEQVQSRHRAPASPAPYVRRAERSTWLSEASPTYKCVASKPVAVGPITAVAGALTVYTLDISGIPAEEAATFTWSGSTCGTAAPEGNRYSWDHREVVVGLSGGRGNRELGRAGDCNHRTDATHGNPEIAVVVTGKTFAARCTFQGAGGGTGPHCVVTPRAR